MRYRDRLFGAVQPPLSNTSTDGIQTDSECSESEGPQASLYRRRAHAIDGSPLGAASEECLMSNFNVTSRKVDSTWIAVTIMIQVAVTIVFLCILSVLKAVCIVPAVVLLILARILQVSIRDIERKEKEVRAQREEEEKQQKEEEEKTRREEASNRSRLRETCRDLLLQAIVILRECEVMQAPQASHFSRLPQSVKDSFSLTSTGGRPMQAVLPQEIYDMSDLELSAFGAFVRELLGARFRDFKPAATAWQQNLRWTIPVLLCFAQRFRSLTSEVPEIRREYRALRRDALTKVFTIADLVCIRPGDFGGLLATNVHPDVLRDITHERAEEFLAGNKPWQRELLAFILVKKKGPPTEEPETTNG